MLYVKTNPEGHYVNCDRNPNFVGEHIHPVLINSKSREVTIPDGSYDITVHIGGDKDKIAVSYGSEKTIYMLGQENTLSWYSKDCYGSKKGNVMLYRLRDEDFVIWQLEPGAWVICDKLCYHNNDGVLMCYDRNTIIGWETWDTVTTHFLDGSVISKTAAIAPEQINEHIRHIRFTL